MIQRASDNQFKLLEVINTLFTYVNDPYTGKRIIRINPKLTDYALQNAIIKTRKYIIDLYVKCEEDYFNGVKIYEAIVESKIIETTQRQIENLKEQAKKIISETKKTSQPIIKPVVIAEPYQSTENDTIIPISSILTPTIPDTTDSSVEPSLSDSSIDTSTPSENGVTIDANSSLSTDSNINTTTPLANNKAIEESVPLANGVNVNENTSLSSNAPVEPSNAPVEPSNPSPENNQKVN